MFKISPVFVKTWKPNDKRKDIYKPRVHIVIHPTTGVTTSIAIKRGGISFRKVMGEHLNNFLDSHQVAELKNDTGTGASVWMTAPAVCQGTWASARRVTRAK